MNLVPKPVSSKKREHQMTETNTEFKMHLINSCATGQPTKLTSEREIRPQAFC